MAWGVSLKCGGGQVMGKKGGYFSESVVINRREVLQVALPQHGVVGVRRQRGWYRGLGAPSACRPARRRTSRANRFGGSGRIWASRLPKKTSPKRGGRCGATFRGKTFETRLGC